ncbi:hypothetical protein KCU98_g3, partial [Aureobasidium melanogenum]
MEADTKTCIDGKCIHVKAVVRNFVVRKADRERFGDQLPVSYIRTNNPFTNCTNISLVRTGPALFPYRSTPTGIGEREKKAFWTLGHPIRTSVRTDSNAILAAYKNLNSHVDPHDSVRGRNTFDGDTYASVSSGSRKRFGTSTHL